MFGAAGFLFYVKILYKRPPITEQLEREKIIGKRASSRPDTVTGLIVFEPMTINIEPVPSQPKPQEGTHQQIAGKLHYATLAFSLEIRDFAKKDFIEMIRPLIVDRVITLLGRRNFRDLTTVQGRYLLRTQLIDDVNSMLQKKIPEEESKKVGGLDGLVTNLFFTQFVVQ